MRIDHLILAVFVISVLVPCCANAQGSDQRDREAGSVQFPERARNALQRDRESLSNADQKLLDRMEHLIQASEHLQRAGLRDEAEKTRARARELARELDDRQAALDPAQMAREIRELRASLEQLREEVGKLREELNRRRVPPVGAGRSPDDFRREMMERAERYRQELEEIRRLHSQPEGRARVPGRKRFSDEELDATPADRPMTGPEEERSADSGREKSRRDEVEFQLVPVPKPEPTPNDGADQKPESTP